LLGAGLLIGCLEPGDEILEKSGESGMVIFVRETSAGRGNNNSIPMANNTNEFYRGTDIYSLSPIGPTGKLVNLTAKWTRATENSDQWGAATDPEVSYDGKKLIFSMRIARPPVGDRSSSDHWHLYEMDINGENLVKLTNNTSADDMDPAYMPDGRIVFTSTRAHIRDEYERREVSNLYMGTRDNHGLIPDANTQQLSFNQSHDFNPFVHSSGKIYFSRWDHLGPPNKIPIFSINPDGTGQFVLFGADNVLNGTANSTGAQAYLEARELADNGIVTSIMERPSVFEGGGIAIFDLGKTINTPPTIITPSSSPINTNSRKSEALYKSPFPIMDNGKERLLVAMSPYAAGGDMDRNESTVNYDLYVMDKDGGNRKLVFASAETNDYDPIVVGEVRLPNIIPINQFVAQGLAQKANTGMFFDANVYSRDRSLDDQMVPDPTVVNHDGSKGQARFVRVLEAVSFPSNYSKRGGELGHTDFEKQRVIGYGPIEEDGSFAIEVPAKKSMHVQTLDENGVMLVNQFQWIHVMPGERRVCSGCHGSRENDKDITKFEIKSNGEVTFDGTKTFIASFAKATKVTEHPSLKGDTLDFFDWRLTNRYADSVQTVNDKREWKPKESYLARTNTVQNVLNQKCNSCHGVAAEAVNKTGLVLEETVTAAIYQGRLSTVYDRLMDDNGYTPLNNGRKMAYVSTRGARRSPLAWVMFHRQLNAEKGNATEAFRIPSYDHRALWSKDSTTNFIDPFKAENRDLLTLIEWIDMGAQFSNSVGDY